MKVAKSKTIYTCQNCGVKSPKWVGKCPSCSEWNTYIEEVLDKGVSPQWDEVDSGKRNSKPALPLKEVQYDEEERITCPDNEFSRVLGGGIVRGSLVLLGGEPGIGKSTLMLQMGLNLNCKTLYVSGEESEQQIKRRADRIGDISGNCFILSETYLDHIFKEIKRIQPDVVVIDSIQTLYTNKVESSSGSVSQV